MHCTHTEESNPANGANWHLDWILVPRGSLHKNMLACYFFFSADQHHHTQGFWALIDGETAGEDGGQQSLVITGMCVHGLQHIRCGSCMLRCAAL